MSLPARLCAVLGLLGLATPLQAAPALWEVRDDDSAIRIFGSVHVLPPDLAWRTPLFDSVLADAHKVIFETDISLVAMTELGARAYVQGIYVDGTLLTDVIDDETERKLRQFATASSLPMGTLLAMKPWLAANTVSAAAMASLGYTAEGVEFVLQPDLAAERLGYLETGDEQLAVLTGGPDDEQLAMLASTLDDIDRMPKLMSKMLQRWMSGNPEALADVLGMEMGGMEAAFMERLIHQRNRNWIAPLEQMLAENAENFIIVGAGHLAGTGSVLELLEQAGYEVERLQ